MRQEIVTHEEAQEHEVIDDPFEVELEGQLDMFEFKVKILSQNGEFNELEWLGLRLSRLLFLFIFLTWSTSMVRLPLDDSLSQDVEVRFMGRQAKHDEVSIGAMNTVRSVGIIVWLSALGPYKIQDFVLTLTGHEGI